MPGEATLSAAAGFGHDELDHLGRDLDVLRHLVLLGHHPLAFRGALLRGRIGELDAVRFQRRARLGLGGGHVGAVGRDVLRPQIGHHLLLIGSELVPERLADQRHIFGDELVILQRELDAGIPKFRADQAFVRRHQPVKGALRQRQRHVGPSRGVRNRAEEPGAPGLARATGIADLHALEVGKGRDRLVRTVPVLESEIEIRAKHVRAQLLLDLAVEELAGLAVDDAVNELDRLAVKHRKLEAIGVGDDAGDGPAARRGHLDLTLDQRLADLEIGIELAAFEQLGLDLAVRGALDLAEIVPHRDVAQMRRRGVERAPQPHRLVGRARRADKSRRRGGGDRGKDKTAA